MICAEIPNLNELKVPELQNELRTLGLKNKGRKSELQRRLVNYYQRIQNPSDQEHKDETEQFNSAQMQDEQERNLNIPESIESCITESTDQEHYVNVNDFQVLIEDFIDFKKFVIERMARNEDSANRDKIAQLTEENKLLKIELHRKQILLDQFLTQSVERKETCNFASRKQTIAEPNNSNTWNTVKQASKIIKHNHMNVNYSVPASPNRFENLNVEDSQDVLYTGAAPRNSFAKKSKTKNNNIKRNGFPIDEQPERNFMHHQQPKYPRTVPGKSSYADMTRRGKKINIFGDSILRRVKGKEMSEEFENGKIYVKAFPGATCNQLSHYITPNLMEQNPDVVVIHVGTNDLKVRHGQHQKSNEEVARSIINIGKQCKLHGVNDVFISGITYRKGFHLMKKVREINDMLQKLCVEDDLHFISHSSIREQHLFQDGIHLSDAGLVILSNNILNSLNATL